MHVDVNLGAAVKAQLENVVLEMYRSGMRYEEAVGEFQSVFLTIVLREQRGNQCRAANTLGMHRNTLRRTLRSLQINPRVGRYAIARRQPRREGGSRTAVPA
jgi:Fis family transcriptional regulator, factor for inversion stimulation protein